MINIYMYYASNVQNTINAMVKSNKRYIEFPTDMEMPSVLFCDNCGTIKEGYVTCAKVTDDGKLKLKITDYDDEDIEYWYTTEELPYMSANGALETIEELIYEKD